jgi:hypothetical protein
MYFGQTKQGQLGEFLKIRDNIEKSGKVEMDGWKMYRMIYES